MRYKLDGIRAQRRVPLLKKMALQCRIAGVQAKSLVYENFIYKVLIDDEDNSGVSDQGTIISPDGIIVTYATRDNVYWGFAEFFGQPISMQTVKYCKTYDQDGNCVEKADAVFGAQNNVGAHLAQSFEVSRVTGELEKCFHSWASSESFITVNEESMVYVGGGIKSYAIPKYTGTTIWESFIGGRQDFYAGATNSVNLVTQKNIPHAFRHTICYVVNTDSGFDNSVDITNIPTQNLVPAASIPLDSILITVHQLVLRTSKVSVTVQCYTITNYTTSAAPTASRVCVATTTVELYTDNSYALTISSPNILLDVPYGDLVTTFDEYQASPVIHTFNRIVWADGDYGIIWGSYEPRHVDPASPVGVMRLDHAPILNPTTNKHEFKYDFTQGDLSGISFPPTTLDQFVRSDYVLMQTSAGEVWALITRQFQDIVSSKHTITHLYFGHPRSSWVEIALPASTYALRLISYTPTIEAVAVANNSTATGLAVWQYLRRADGNYSWAEISQLDQATTPADPEQYLWAVGLFGNPVTSRDRAAGSIPAFPSLWSPM